MPQSLLDKIDSADHHVKLYAFNGLAASMASEIEDTLFWCFTAASERSWEDAFDTFHKNVKFGRKRALADAAIRAKVRNTPYAEKWDGLNRRLQALLGEGGSDRNLVSHNPVQHAVYADGPLEDEQTQIRVVQQVAQNKAMVARRGRTAKTVTASEMRGYCSSLIGLYQDLERFAEEPLKFPQSHPLRCEHR